jgi:hypothetical protein
MTGSLALGQRTMRRQDLPRNRALQFWRGGRVVDKFVWNEFGQPQGWPRA